MTRKQVERPFSWRNDRHHTASHFEKSSSINKFCPESRKTIDLLFVNSQERIRLENIIFVEGYHPLINESQRESDFDQRAMFPFEFTPNSISLRIFSSTSGDELYRGIGDAF
jgi:hypothetical protein